MSEQAQDSISSLALLHDVSMIDRIQRLAEIMASGKTTVPTHLRGSVGDCFAVCMQAMQWGMNPFAVAQKTHLVNGALGYEAQLVAAVINNSRVVADRFRFEWFGPWDRVVGKYATKRNEQGKEYRTPSWTMSDEEGCGVRVSATLRGEREPRVLELLLSQARVRNSSLWADDPKQQLAYLAQKKWARLYAPDVILGVYTPDEFEQPTEIHMGDAEVVTPAKPEMPPYPADRFAGNLPQWQALVESGRKTPDDIIAMIQSKAMLTQEQIAAIRGLGVTDVDPETGEVFAAKADKAAGE